MIGKIVNGKLITPPINFGNRFNVFKDSEWLSSNGFHKLTIEDFKQLKHISPVRKYSKFKIVEILGEAWPIWKQKIEEAGMMEYWESCNYLASDHKAFRKFYRQLSAEERKLLNTKCRWEE